MLRLDAVTCIKSQLFCLYLHRKDKEMSAETIRLILICSAALHFVLSCVVGVFARYKSQYISLAWVNGLFSFALVGLSLISTNIAEAQPVIMHPIALFVLSAATFLQSIYPLGLTMPGFLNWGRMTRYAVPAIVLPMVYIVLTYIHGESIDLKDINQLGENFYSWDVVLRVASVLLSGYYIINIYRLPRKMARKTEVPTYLLGYTTALTLSMFFYMFASVFYAPLYIGLYAVIFTLLNIDLVFRSLAEIAKHLPQPVADLPDETEAEQPEEPAEAEEENDDFNQANIERYQRIKYWMRQHREEWTEPDFGRNRLCESIGLNRHLVLQTVRSQGFYNIHEFLMLCRAAELKRLIRKGDVTKPSDCILAGFGTVVTARASFQKMEGVSLDEYLQRYAAS